MTSWATGRMRWSITGGPPTPRRTACRRHMRARSRKPGWNSDGASDQFARHAPAPDPRSGTYTLNCKHWISMGRSVLHSASLIAALLLGWSAALGAYQSPAVQSAAAAMARGDFQTAEKDLRAELVAHPGDAWVESLLGVALDNQKRLPEAEEFHGRAVAASPRSEERR